jgi:putative membrane protein
MHDHPHDHDHDRGCGHDHGHGHAAAPGDERRPNAGVTANNFMRVTVILAWLLAFAWLLPGGVYQRFLQTALWPLLAMGVVLLVLFGMGVTSRPMSQGPTGNRWGRLVAAGVLLLPLAYLFGVPADGLGSHAFSKRYVSGQTIAGARVEPLAPAAEAAEALGAPGPPLVTPDAEPRDAAGQVAQSAPRPIASPSTVDDEAALARVNLLALHYQAEQLQGRRIAVEGMVYRDAQLPAGHFVLFRFVVTCCAADAQPVGALVKSDLADELRNDTWVRVTGGMSIAAVEGKRGALIDAGSVERISPPIDQYLSPFDPTVNSRF